MNDEARTKILEDAVLKLSEHFDAIQICASRVSRPDDECLTDEGETQTFFSGHGDWNSRLFMCSRLVRRDSERERISIEKDEADGKEQGS